MEVVTWESWERVGVNMVEVAGLLRLGHEGQEGPEGQEGQERQEGHEGHRLLSATG